MDKPDDKSEAVSQKIQFHFIKSSFFRVIGIDGVLGGITPRGDINATLFSERLPIPDVIEHDLDENGMLSKKARVVSKKGVVRETEATLVLNSVAARDIGQWLIRKADELDKLFDDAEIQVESDEYNLQQGS
ncbi:MAG TPA: hypothetical protein VF648_08690 [Pyrinomonadaceae bacterium]|jgi:hypothetical protein